MRGSSRPSAAGIATVPLAAPGSVGRYRLQAGEFALEFVTVGAAVTRLEVPSRGGKPVNVVLGHARLARYGRGREYFGAIAGRLANRLRDALLRVEGVTFPLQSNDGRHHLHGGRVGFDRRHWQVVAVEVRGGRACATLEYVSRDGEEGYPGELRVRVNYAVGADGAFETVLAAVTNRTTVVNLTNHSYFNLRGEGEGNVLEHELWVAADRYCVVDADLLPTGELRPVAGTAFDFRVPKRIGQDIASDDPQLRLAGGYDHCLVLGPNGPEPDGALRSIAQCRRACELHDPDSGRRLEVWTDQPGVQLYTGNFLHGGIVGCGGRPYGRHAGLCLETQRFPDAPNHPHFPSVVLHPGETYSARTVWRFTC